MRLFERLVILVLFPVNFLSTVGAIIAGIWLIVIGEWKLVLVSFFGTTLSSMLIGFALLPQFAIAVPARYFAKRHNQILTYFFAALSQLYAAALIVIWSASVLYYFAPTNTLHSFSTTAPYLFWAYGVAVSPWTYLVIQDSGDNDLQAPMFSYAPLFSLFLQIGLLAAILVIIMLDASPIVGGYVILGAMIIALCVIIPLTGNKMLVAGVYQALDEKIHLLSHK